jgi:acyl-coenzyme A thioesterase PaaI-like protein
MLPSAERIRGTILLRTFGFLKVPLIWWVQPQVIELNDQRTVIKIPLTRRTKNHLKSMYFGTLCVGADCAAGIYCFDLFRKSGKKVSFAFKDVSAQFLKRADGDVVFTCTAANQIKELADLVLNSTERHETPVDVIATVPAKYGTEPVATFKLTLSAKRR